MKTLRQLQIQLQQYLLDEKAAPLLSIVGTKALSKKTRLSIYKEAYHLRLLEALENHYPCLQSEIGITAFAKVAKAYCKAHPSKNRSIRFVGDMLHAFLAKNNSPSYLIELAQWEWGLTLAFDAKDTPVWTQEEMRALPQAEWPSMRFTFHPSLQHYRFFWNVTDIWQDWVTSAKTRITPKAYSTPISVVLWRQEYTNRFTTVSEIEAYALSLALKGSSCSELCAKLCEKIPEEEVSLQYISFLQKWIGLEWLSEVIGGRSVL
jgi:hypothetical protein